MEGNPAKKEINTLTISKEKQKLLMASFEEKNNLISIGLTSLCHS